MRNSKCLDCAVDTHEINEYYMVHDELWLMANPADYGELCIGCLESRIGRKLNANDFTNYAVNKGFFEQSDRLKERLSNEV